MPKLLIKTSKNFTENALILKDNCTSTGPEETCIHLVDPKETYEISTTELKNACERFREMLSDPDKLEGNRDRFIRAAFFDINDLQDVIQKTKARHIKIYCGIDQEGKNFMFVAPIYMDGRALDDDDTFAALCCCSVPPCPKNLKDRYLAD